MKAIEKEHGKNFRLTLTTNGVLVDDDAIEWTNRACHNVVLSPDGRKEIHDRFRVDYAGKSSRERIVPRFQKFVESRNGKCYCMRGTYRGLRRTDRQKTPRKSSVVTALTPAAS